MNIVARHYKKVYKSTKVQEYKSIVRSSMASISVKIKQTVKCVQEEKEFGSSHPKH